MKQSKSNVRKGRVEITFGKSSLKWLLWYTVEKGASKPIIAAIKKTIKTLIVLSIKSVEIEKKYKKNTWMNNVKCKSNIPDQNNLKEAIRCHLTDEMLNDCKKQAARMFNTIDSDNDKMSHELRDLIHPKNNMKLCTRWKKSLNKTFSSLTTGKDSWKTKNSISIAKNTTATINFSFGNQPYTIVILITFLATLAGTYATTNGRFLLQLMGVIKLTLLIGGKTTVEPQHSDSHVFQFPFLTCITLLTFLFLYFISRYGKYIFRGEIVHVTQKNVLPEISSTDGRTCINCTLTDCVKSKQFCQAEAGVTRTATPFTDETKVSIIRSKDEQGIFKRTRNGRKKSGDTHVWNF